MHGPNIHGHNLRGHSKKLCKNRARLNVRKYYYTQRVVDTWNALPQKVVQAPSVLAFERRLDRHWSTQDIRYDYEADLTQGDPTGYSSEDSDLDIEA
jgi:hypothetical protein